MKLNKSFNSIINS